MKLEIKLDTIYYDLILMKAKEPIDIYEKSITTDYRSELWSKFIKAILEYKLLKDGDKIAVCISGGKDSMVLAKLFMTLTKVMDYNIEVKYLVMNPGYNEKNLNLIKENLKKLNIPAEIHQTDIFEIANMQTKSPCFLCAKMRRGALYNIAKSMGCNKIALGHHYDDVIETTLMNILSSGSFQTMLPKLHSTHYEGMEVIRPMYYIREYDIISFRRKHGLEFIQCACKFTDDHHNDLVQSRRAEVKELIKKLSKSMPQVEENLFKAPDNVTLDMVLGYKYKGEYHSYYDNYDEDDKEK